MYCPAQLEENRPEVLHALIAQHPLASIIVNGPEGLVADHVPLMFVPVAGALGKLIGHVARNNPLWQAPSEREHLIVFQGPGHYISPNWYASKAEHGKAVPTWNYVVVHARATLRALEAPAEILPILERQTAFHEAGQPHPWAIADAPAAFTERLLNHIVGIEFTLTALQGKWKVSQNQPAENRQSLVVGLRAEQTEAALQMAGLISTP